MVTLWRVKRPQKWKRRDYLCTVLPITQNAYDTSVLGVTINYIRQQDQ